MSESEWQHVPGCNPLCDGDSHWLEDDGNPAPSPPGAPRTETCPDCEHQHTPDGCVGEPSPFDLWAGVTPAACDCDSAPRTETANERKTDG